MWKSWHLTLRLLGPEGRVLPNVPIDGICSSHFRTLVMVWTLFCPMSHLSTDYAFASCLVLSGLGVCQRGSLEGSQHLCMPCLSLSFSPFPGPCLPSPVLCYERYWWLSGPSRLKTGSCCCSCCNVILMSDVHWDRNLSFKINCPL